MDNHERDERTIDSGLDQPDAYTLDTDTLDLGDLYPPEPEFGTSFADLRAELIERWSRLSRGGAVPTESLLQPVGIDLRGPASAVLTRVSSDSLQLSHMGVKLAHFDDPRRNQKGAFLLFLDCLGEQAIDSGLPLDFEHWDQFRPGQEEQVRGLALPLSDDGRRCNAVLAVFDTDATGSRDIPQDSAPTDEELLLEQEFDPDGEPEAELPRRSAPYFVVATSNRTPRALPMRPRRAPTLRLTSSDVEPEKPSRFSVTLTPAPPPVAENPPPVAEKSPPAEEPAAPPHPVAQSAPAADQPDDSPAALADKALVQARSLAQAAAFQEQRSHHALYDALGAAYEVMHRLFAAPEHFAEILAEANLTMQERAPMTPVVKLVFGAHYDRTRISEYAAVLAHAHRQRMPEDALSAYLKDLDGGIRTIVQKERELRQGSDPAASAEAMLAPKVLSYLRKMPTADLTSLADEGEEFALVLVRRGDAGAPQVIGEVPPDKALLNRATRRVIEKSRE